MVSVALVASAVSVASIGLVASEALIGSGH